MISIHGGQKVSRSISIYLLKIIAVVLHLLIESTELLFLKKKTLAAGAIFYTIQFSERSKPELSEISVKLA
jgi:hypothetical protein